MAKSQRRQKDQGRAKSAALVFLPDEYWCLPEEGMAIIRRWPILGGGYLNDRLNQRTPNGSAWVAQKPKLSGGDVSHD